MKATHKIVFSLVALLLVTVAANAQSPAGTWQIYANGYPSTLILTVDTAGTVTGWYETSGGVDISYDPVKGFWSAAGRKLTIYRAIGGTTANTSPEQIQVFTGYMFPASVSSPSGPQRLAGFFEAFAGTGGSAARSVFGWFATK